MAYVGQSNLITKGDDMPQGEKTGKLSKAQVRWYKKNMYRLTLKQAAEVLPVSTAQLCRIRSGENWGNV